MPQNQRGREILLEGGGNSNGIKVHDQQGQPANWITRCAVGWYVSYPEPNSIASSPTVIYLLPMYPSRFIRALARVHMFTHTLIHSRAPFFSVDSHESKIYSCTIQSSAPYSSCTRFLETRYGIPTWHRNWFALQLYRPPLSLSFFPFFSPSRRAASLAAFPLPRLPTSQQPRSLVIGFPRFSQLFFKSLATLFSRLALLFFSTACARVASRTTTGKGSVRGTIGRQVRAAVDSLLSDASIALFRCEGSLKRLKKLNCAFIVNYLESCLNVSRKQPAEVLSEFSITWTTVSL